MVVVLKTCIDIKVNKHQGGDLGTQKCHQYSAQQACLVHYKQTSIQNIQKLFIWKKNWTKTVHLTACILVEFLDITDTSINQQQWYKRDWFSFKIYITIYICIWHCSDQGKIFDKKYGVYFCFCYKFPTWHPRLLHRKSLYSYIIIL